MDDVLVNTSTRSKTRHTVIEADSYVAMRRGTASPPTSKSATPKPIRRNVERFLRLRLRKIQMIRIFPVMKKLLRIQNIISRTYSKLWNPWQWGPVSLYDDAGESKQRKISTMLDEFLFFFINIHHVKFCFATNVWLRNSVVSTVLIFRRNLYNLTRCFYGKLSTFLMVNELTRTMLR